ncbi:hypothetical protein [uncultured Aquimarina sp.]|uniref:hypothetical protein n=1 Tax=uncultured Aquimarina sp. TaxID=575652 RepID=UPI002617DB48|nr:hypothetical protein [uncultured Aquimarina sp.]
MKVIFVVFFVIGLQHNLSAQSIEIVDNDPDVELNINSKFLSFQENTVFNTCIGIDEVDVKNQQISLANKPLTQLMYWRYEVMTSMTDKMKSIASISSYTSKEEFTSLGRRLFDLGVINNIIN